VAGLLGLVGATALAGSVWTSRADAQLVRPGEDPRPMSTRLVDPLPLPVRGDVRVTGDVMVSAAQPLPVQVVAAAAPPPPPFMEPGRCYFIDVHGAPIWRDALWRVDAIQGAWIRVRLARADADAQTAWVNTARLTRISEPQRCE
jgi:hypothetical protein